jgi:hypothetical protein
LLISQTNYGEAQTGKVTLRKATRLAQWKIPNTGEDCWLHSQLNYDGEQGLAEAGPRVSFDSITLAGSDLDNMVNK